MTVAPWGHVIRHFLPSIRKGCALAVVAERCLSRVRGGLGVAPPPAATRMYKLQDPDGIH